MKVSHTQSAHNELPSVSSCVEAPEMDSLLMEEDW